jgi:arsenite methyltransferase
LLSKKELMKDYNASAGIYDMRYKDEQTLKMSFVMSRIRVKQEDIVIDIGCGTGIFLEHLHNNRNKAGLLVGIDSSINMLREAKRKNTDIELVLADAEKMPFKDASCDAAFSFSVFQLMSNPRKGISELIRVSKDGGKFAVTVLRKSKKAHRLGSFKNTNMEIYDSETMKDVFLIGCKTVTDDGC